MTDTCVNTLVQTHLIYNTKSDPDINYKLWVIVMFIDYKQMYQLMGIWRAVEAEHMLGQEV